MGRSSLFSRMLRMLERPQLFETFHSGASKDEDVQLVERWRVWELRGFEIETKSAFSDCDTHCHDLRL